MTQHTPVGSKWLLVSLETPERIAAEVVEVLDRDFVVIRRGGGARKKVYAAMLMSNALRVKEPTP